jgi:putative hemolysin
VRHIGLNGGTETELGEADVQYRAEAAYTLDNMRIVVRTHGGGDTCTVRMRINGADGNLNISGTAVGLFEDLSNSDTVAVNDLLNWEMDSTAQMHGDSYAPATLQVDFSLASDLPPIIAHCHTNNTAVYWGIAASATEYCNVQGGGGDHNGAESTAEITLRTAQTFDELRVYVLQYGGTSSGFVLRKNRATGNLNVTITATGEFTDVSNSDSFSVGDEINYRCVNSGGSEMRIGECSLRGDSDKMFIAFVHATSATLGPNNFLTNGINHPSAESEAEVGFYSDRTLGNFAINVWTHATTTTLTVRKNRVATSMAVTLSAVGYFEDLSNTVDVADGDEISARASGSSSLKVATGVLECGPLAAAAKVPKGLQVARAPSRDRRGRAAAFGW